MVDLLRFLKVTGDMPGASCLARFTTACDRQGTVPSCCTNLMTDETAIITVSTANPYTGFNLVLKPHQMHDACVH